MTNYFTQPPTELIELKDFAAGYQVFLKRDDLIHPIISGNKWRKLKYNLLQARKQKKNTLITKGGAYSNHIAAVACAGKELGFETVGIIRGERPKELGFTLRMVQEMGMHLEFVSRDVYKGDLFQKFEKSFLDAYYIPEGGTNKLSPQGCKELVDELQTQIDLQLAMICLACGTGGTTAGIVAACSNNAKIIGFSALKGIWLQSQIENFLGYQSKNLSITDEFCIGGYAKISPELISFINKFYEQFGIPLDPVYTGKMMFGLQELLINNRLTPGSKIVAIHTGGLQGAFGFAEQGINIDWINDSNCLESQQLKKFFND